MGKDKKFIDAGKNVASSIFQKRNDYIETHKEEAVVIDEVEEEKKLISPNSFGNRIVSADVAKQLDIEEPKHDDDIKSTVKKKKPTQKELEEAQRVENEKIDIFAGLMTRGGELKPSLIVENEPEVIPEVQEEPEEEELDYSYDVTSQFYTRAIKPIDKSPKK